MKYLITGGSGFIGRHLTRALLAAGHEVRILDNFVTGRQEDLPAGVEIVMGDAADPRRAAQAVEGVSGVFHLAAIPSVVQGETQALQNQRSGEIALLAMLTAAQHSGSVKRLVFASSAAVYGDATGSLISEDSPTGPVSNYGVSKMAGELYLRTACRNGTHLDAACLRFFNVYGPGQRKESSYAGVITRFMECLAENRPPTIFGSGDQTRDFIWVGDVVEACILAMDAPGKLHGHPFNVGTGVSTSVRSVWEVLAAATGTRLEPTFQHARPGEVTDSRADVRRAAKVFGFQARVSLQSGVRELWKSFSEGRGA
jgi:UDP-glucose 4-epimerase